MAWRWRVVVLRLTKMPRWRSKRLTVGAIEHGLFSFPAIMSIGTAAVIRLARDRGTGGVGSVDGIGRDKGSLR